MTWIFLTFLMLGAAALARLEIPFLLKRGKVRELWAFVAVTLAALTMLTLAIFSVSATGPQIAMLLKAQALLGPWLQPPPP